jgi:hypothetical protein
VILLTLSETWIHPPDRCTDPHPVADTKATCHTSASDVPVIEGVGFTGFAAGNEEMALRDRTLAVLFW